ncbi:MAG: nitronate monooxygenase family protein [Dehalococcoidales bacterium]|nr:nitronate monooxygenase family protein [Dehalococcoidales bacterium]
MFHTRLCDLLGIKYPIIQGALGGVSGGPILAAAVSNAGGLGVLASFGLTTTQLRDEIAQTRALTDRPFALNIFAANPAFVQRVTKVAVEEGITIVTTGRGDPRQPIISILKEHGVIVLPVVPTVRHAVRLEAEGADAIIASGMEAGGHVGSVCSLPLIPQVVSAVKVPVVAAGGIGDARGFVAALALGACGIQMGTRFVVTHESGTSLERKQKILAASEEDTMLTPVLTGRNVRVIKNLELEEWAQRQREGASPQELEDLARQIRGKRSDKPGIGVTAGQISGMIKEIKNAGDIVKEIIDEAESICKNLILLADSE